MPISFNTPRYYSYYQQPEPLPYLDIIERNNKNTEEFQKSMMDMTQSSSGELNDQERKMAIFGTTISTTVSAAAL